MDAPASDARDAAAARGASALDAAACIPRDVETPGPPPPPPPGAPLARDASPARPWRALAAETPYALPARSPRAEAPPDASLARTLARYVPARSTEAPPSRGVVDDRGSRREPPVEPPSDARLASGSLAGPAYYDASLASSERHWAEALLDAAERKRRRERRRKRGRVAAEESTLPGRSSSGDAEASRRVASASAPASAALECVPSLAARVLRDPAALAIFARSSAIRLDRGLVPSPPNPNRLAAKKLATPTSFRPLPPPSAIVGYQDEWLEAPIDRVAIAPRNLWLAAPFAPRGGRRKPVALALVAPEEEEEEEEGAGGPPGRARSLAAQTLAEIAAQYELCGLGACERLSRAGEHSGSNSCSNPSSLGVYGPRRRRLGGAGTFAEALLEVRDAAAALDRPSAVVAFVAVAEEEEEEEDGPRGVVPEATRTLSRHKRPSEEVAIEPTDRKRARRGEAVSSHRSGVVPASAFVPARLDAILAASVALAAATPTEERKRSFFSARDGHSALVVTLPRRRLGRARATQAFARAMAFDAFERSARPRLEAKKAAARGDDGRRLSRAPEAEEGPAPGASSPASLRAGVRASDVAGRSRRGGGLPEHEPPSVLAAEQRRDEPEPDAEAGGDDPSAAAKKINDASAADSAALVPGTHCCYAYARAAAKTPPSPSPSKTPPSPSPSRDEEDVVWLVAAWTDAVGEVFATEARAFPATGRFGRVDGSAFAWLARRTAALASAAERAAGIDGSDPDAARGSPFRRAVFARARVGEARGGPAAAAAAAAEEEEEDAEAAADLRSLRAALAGFARDDAEAETETGGDAFFVREIALAEIETGVLDLDLDLDDGLRVGGAIQRVACSRDAWVETRSETRLKRGRSKEEEEVAGSGSGSGSTTARFAVAAAARVEAGASFFSSARGVETRLRAAFFVRVLEERPDGETGDATSLRLRARKGEGEGEGTRGASDLASSLARWYARRALLAEALFDPGGGEARAAATLAPPHFRAVVALADALERCEKKATSDEGDR